MDWSVSSDRALSDAGPCYVHPSVHPRRCRAIAPDGSRPVLARPHAHDRSLPSFVPPSLPTFSLSLSLSRCPAVTHSPNSLHFLWIAVHPALAAMIAVCVYMFPIHGDRMREVIAMQGGVQKAVPGTKSHKLQQRLSQQKIKAVEPKVVESVPATPAEATKPEA